MRTLRRGSRGHDVERWQLFLTGQTLDPGPGAVDGVFGKRTEAATIAFQRKHGLLADGIAGLRTLGQAMLLGFDTIEDRDDPVDLTEHGPGWPPPPHFAPLVGTAARQRIFGEFRYEHAPEPGNPEAIRMLGGWEAENIVTVTLPELPGLRGAPASGPVRFHRLAARQLAALWAAWAARALLDGVPTWDGSFAPRFIRGSRTRTRATPSTPPSTSTRPGTASARSLRSPAGRAASASSSRRRTSTASTGAGTYSTAPTACTSRSPS